MLEKAIELALAKAGATVINSVCSVDETDEPALAAEGVAIGPDLNDIDIIRLLFDQGLSALDEAADSFRLQIN